LTHFSIACIGDFGYQNNPKTKENSKIPPLFWILLAIEFAITFDLIQVEPSILDENNCLDKAVEHPAKFKQS
jgi:hypothetical protein